jgi:hypothetical protein
VSEATCDLCLAEISDVATSLEVLVFACGHLAHACFACRVRHEHPEAPNGAESMIARLRKVHAENHDAQGFAVSDAPALESAVVVGAAEPADASEIDFSGFAGIDRSVGDPIDWSKRPRPPTAEDWQKLFAEALPFPAPRPMLLPPNAPESLVAAAEGDADRALRLRAAENKRAVLIARLKACRCEYPDKVSSNGDPHAPDCPARALVR